MVIQRSTLLLDCSNSWIIVGLQIEGKFYGIPRHAPREAFRLLPGMIEVCLKQGGIKKPDQIACVRGPGSFTGTRLAVATARNLAQLWQIPVYACDSLSYYASESLQEWRLQNSNPKGFPDAGSLRK